MPNGVRQLTEKQEFGALPADRMSPPEGGLRRAPEGGPANLDNEALLFLPWK